QRSSLEYMKANRELFEIPAIQKNRFIYKGTNGRWRNLLTPEEIEKYQNISCEKLESECEKWLNRG
ncbi:MAG: sulfotransferase domain-containing protein, partial [Cyanobacteria bacterium J06635_10]